MQWAENKTVWPQQQRGRVRVSGGSYWYVYINNSISSPPLETVIAWKIIVCKDLFVRTINDNNTYGIISLLCIYVSMFTLNNLNLLG